MNTVVRKIGYTLPFLPLVTLAGTTNTEVDPSYITGVIDDVATIVSSLIPLVIALGLLFFIWGLVQFIFASGDEAAKDEGKRKMIWGVIALFVIVSVWGLVALLNQITGVDQGGQVTTPKIPTAAPPTAAP